VQKVTQLEFEDEREDSLKSFMFLWNNYEHEILKTMPQLKCASDSDKIMQFLNVKEFFLSLSKIPEEDRREIWLGHLLMLFQADLIDSAQLLQYNSTI